MLNLRRAVPGGDTGLLSVRRAVCDNRVDLHLAIGGGFARAGSADTTD